jgi:hypothetical protein
MTCCTDLNGEYTLPSLEAVLAGTLALMTGYSQALQADRSPEPRLMMGVKIGKNLDLLSDHPGVTDAFRRVIAGLRQRWAQMSACTELSAPAAVAGSAACADRGQSEPVPTSIRAPVIAATIPPTSAPDLRLAVAAPTRLQ